MGNPEDVKAEELAKQAAADVLEQAPPPYAPHAGSSVSKPSEAFKGPTHTAPIRMSVLATPHGRFPPVVNAYYQWKITRTYHLGDSTNHKIFAISNFAGLTGKGPGKKSLVLYNGPSTDSPALAIAGEVGEDEDLDMYHVTTAITLPPLIPTSGSVVEAGPSARDDTRKGPDAVVEIMDTLKARGLGTTTFRFSIEVGQGEPTGLRREAFEWRRQDGVDLGGFKCSYQLVRLEAEGGEGGLESHSAGKATVDDEKSHSGAPDSPESKNGTVAVARWKSMMSLNKPFSFWFKGQGLTGELGNRWEVMALVSALRLWFVDIQQRL